MVKIDLITGFLGAGKTTFIKEYASYLLRQGLNIGILENDECGYDASSGAAGRKM